jgi:hypothetical protein
MGRAGGGVVRGDWTSDDENAISPGLWRVNLERSLYSPKGQATLRDLEAALLALPVKRLVGNDLAADGTVCAIGALEAYIRVIKYGWTWEEVLSSMQEEYVEEDDGNALTVQTGRRHGFSTMAASEVAMQNDEVCSGMPPEERYEYMLMWTRRYILPADRSLEA